MKNKYCLDTNFFIEGWNKYYSPDFCSSYWDTLDILAHEGSIFITHEVKKEIDKVDDSLKKWLKGRDYLIKEIDENVQKCIRILYSSNPNHKYLANDMKNRSLADPWVIAHAMAENAIVVSKEFLSTSSNKQKIKIPDVCKNMNIECIDDFEFIRRINLKFDCRF